MRLRWLIALGSLLIAAGCAHVPNKAADPNGSVLDEDPLEPFNRTMYQFNYTLDGLVIRPVTQIYRGVMPAKGQEMMSNFLENLYAPVVFANSVFQADPQNSFATFWRFMINSTFGIGGLFDAASEIPLKNRTTDFGQTLGIYGAGPGPYIVLPVIGPSNGRDAIGRLADALINPFNYAAEPWPYVMWGATVIDKRSQNMKLIDDIYETSLDPYTTFRSGYTQKRASDVRRAKAARDKALEKAMP